MKKLTILEPDDVARYIADAFCVSKDNVYIKTFMETKGYGLGEHDEPTFRIEVEEEK